MKLPLATQTKDGILTNAAQNMAGAKTFYNAAGSTVLGSFSDAGAWTLGPTSGTASVTHTLESYTTANNNGTVIRNREATTASDVSFACRFIKGSSTTSTSQKFVSFEISAGAAGSGMITANGASTAAFGSYSDVRLKTNITNLPNQLSSIMALRPVEFDYIAGGHQVGFIAQEIKTIYPDSVSGDENIEGDYLILTGWSKTEARLVKAIQELKQQFDDYVATHP